MTSPDKQRTTKEAATADSHEIPHVERKTFQEYINDFGRFPDWGDTDAAGLELEAICYPDEGSDAANEITALLSEGVRPLFDDARRLERDAMYGEYDLQLDPERGYEHFVLPANERAEIMERLTNALGQRLSGSEDPDTGTYIATWEQDGQVIPVRELSAHDLLVLSVALRSFGKYKGEDKTLPDTEEVRCIKEIMERNSDGSYTTLGAVKLAVDGQLRDPEARRIMLGTEQDPPSPVET